MDRYKIRLSTKHLKKLVVAASIFNPLDAVVWLKIQLIELNCLPCGCTSPPLIRLTVALHIDWCKGFMPVPIRGEAKYKLPFDRRRAGRNPGYSESQYNGETEKIKL